MDTFDYKPELRKYANKSLPQDKKYINSGAAASVSSRRTGGPSDRGPERSARLRLFSERPPGCRQVGGAQGLPCRQPRARLGAGCHEHRSTFIGRPSLGAWSVYGLGTENQSLPGYVVCSTSGRPYLRPTKLVLRLHALDFQGTLFRPSGNPILDLKGPGHLDARAQRRQLDLLAKLNQKHLRTPRGQELAARIHRRTRLWMQSEAPDAVNLSLEKQATRDMYGSANSRPMSTVVTALSPDG
ncbi:MAG: hypothetical protein CM1200mP29_06780 [Verrucomicrobiota bacterium]|nr:MAG: hypothetical protein CM1200mP29_06780 [Verrucomicrobiota bacterium]